MIMVMRAEYSPFIMYKRGRLAGAAQMGAIAYGLIYVPGNRPGVQ